jgi:hypothetical protein
MALLQQQHSKVIKARDPLIEIEEFGSYRSNVLKAHCPVTIYVTRDELGER